MLWVKALHIVFMVTWFSGLFYLPRIFVYHAMSTNEHEQETFKVMERKLLIMTHIGGALTLVFGLMLLFVWLPALATQSWMLWKLFGVLLLVLYHIICVKLVSDFKHNRNKYSHKAYRLFNEIPVLFLFAVVILVVVKPG